MLFKMIELPSDESVQFVGVYVLKWGRVDEPTVAFREATPEEIAAEQSVQRTASPPCSVCGSEMKPLYPDCPVCGTPNPLTHDRC